MSGHIAAYISIGLSVVALLTCAVSVPMIYTKITEINIELASDAGELQMLYQEVSSAAKQGGRTGQPIARITRQIAGPQCSKF